MLLTSMVIFNGLFMCKTTLSVGCAYTELPEIANIINQEPSVLDTKLKYFISSLFYGKITR